MKTLREFLNEVDTHGFVPASSHYGPSKKDISILMHQEYAFDFAKKLKQKSVKVVKTETRGEIRYKLHLENGAYVEIYDVNANDKNDDGYVSIITSDNRTALYIVGKEAGKNIDAVVERVANKIKSIK